MFKVKNLSKMTLNFMAGINDYFTLPASGELDIEKNDFKRILAGLRLQQSADRIAVEDEDGNAVDLSDDDEKADEAVTIGDIVEAIDLLDPDTDGHYTKGGKPEVAALENVLGQDITASQRDEAWKEYQAAE